MKIFNFVFSTYLFLKCYIKYIDVFLVKTVNEHLRTVKCIFGWNLLEATFLVFPVLTGCCFSGWYKVLLVLLNSKH